MHHEADPNEGPTAEAATSRNRSRCGRHRRSAIALVASMFLVVQACSSDQPSATREDPEAWVETFCDGYIDFATRADYFDSLADDDANQATADQLRAILAAADEAGGAPPTDYVNYIDQMRRSVETADFTDLAQPFADEDLCNAAVGKKVPGERFVLSPLPTGFGICNIEDLELATALTGQRVGPGPSSQVSLWSDGSPEDAFSGIAALVRSPAPSKVLVPDDTQPTIEAVPAQSAEAWNVTATFPASLRESGANGIATPSTTASASETTRPVATAEDAVVTLTVLGADEATAIDIARSIGFEDGELTLDVTGLEPLIQPTDVGYFFDGAWMVVTASDAHMVSVGPTDLSVADAELLAAFDELAPNAAALGDDSGAEAAMSDDAGQDPLNDPMSDEERFPAQSLDINGQPSVVTGGPKGGSLYMNMGDSTVRIASIGQPQTESSLTDLLTTFAADLQPATGEEWLDFRSTHRRQAVETADDSRPCPAPGQLPLTEPTGTVPPS